MFFMYVGLVYVFMYVQVFVRICMYVLYILCMYVLCEYVLHAGSCVCLCLCLVLFPHLYFFI